MVNYQRQAKLARRYRRGDRARILGLSRPTAMKRGIIPYANKGCNIKLRHVTFVGCDGVGVITDTVTASLVVATGNYGSLSALYDAYAVKAIRVEYIPINVGAEGIAGSAAPYVRGTTIKMVDVDGTNLPGTVAAAIEYYKAKACDPRKKITQYYKIPKMYRSQLNDFSVGWNTQNKDTTIMMVGDSYLPVNTNFYLRYATFYVSCYGGR